MNVRKNSAHKILFFLQFFFCLLLLFFLFRHFIVIIAIHVYSEHIMCHDVIPAQCTYNVCCVQKQLAEGHIRLTGGTERKTNGLRFVRHQPPAVSIIVCYKRHQSVSYHTFSLLYPGREKCGWSHTARDVREICWASATIHGIYKMVESTFPHFECVVLMSMTKWQFLGTLQRKCLYDIISRFCWMLRSFRCVIYMCEQNSFGYHNDWPMFSLLWLSANIQSIDAVSPGLVCWLSRIIPTRLGLLQ